MGYIWALIPVTSVTSVTSVIMCPLLNFCKSPYRRHLINNSKKLRHIITKIFRHVQGTIRYVVIAFHPKKNKMVAIPDFPKKKLCITQKLEEISSRLFQACIRDLNVGYFYFQLNTKNKMATIADFLQNSTQLRLITHKLEEISWTIR